MIHFDKNHLAFLPTQHYRCVTMLPEFDTEGNLPPGIHGATWEEFQARYGSNAHRRRLLSGLGRAAQVLKACGCQTLYVDGSFVTAKAMPADFDGCWERAGMSLTALQIADPVLLTFSNGRAAQKTKYFGELFPADIAATGLGTTFLKFFQRDKDTGNAKGIAAIDLGSL